MDVVMLCRPRAFFLPTVRQHTYQRFCRSPVCVSWPLYFNPPCSLKRRPCRRLASLSFFPPAAYIILMSQLGAFLHVSWGFTSIWSYFLFYLLPCILTFFLGFTGSTKAAGILFFIPFIQSAGVFILCSRSNSDLSVFIGLTSGVPLIIYIRPYQSVVPALPC
ncbi:hypothetical protein GALMADRAFT_413781 [Galerina marginata CBS 339.88]|uniref:Uncharacterized protein n=1 Tax=Galerina marginata (strain CBS 339.88) TaxID=685588 RepID=A0A067T629_GALM3|nr:hypothetical protein GALMADRAFT_413781 [Galerina marginata CBS 339.88]